MSSKILLGLAVLALTACQPLATATPPPTPDMVRVQVSGAAAAWRTDLHDCAGGIPEMGLVVDELPTPALDPSKADFVLRFGAPADLPSAAYSLGQETIQVITHSENPIETLSQDDLQAIYRDEITLWEEIGSAETGGMDTGAQVIEAWTYLPGEDVRTKFDAVVPGDGLPVSTNLHVAPSPQAMLEAVSENPGAIGYIPSRWVDDTVQVIELPLDLQEQLTLDVLALASHEPQGLPRRLLECLQANP